MENLTFYDLHCKVLPHILLLDTVTIHPPYVHYRRQAEEYILYYLISGEMHLTENNVSYHLTAGDLLLLDPKYEHFGTKADTCHYFYIHFQHTGLIEQTALLSDLKDSLLALRMSALSSQDTAPFLQQAAPSLILPKHLHLSSALMLSFQRELYQLKNSHHNRQEYHTLETSYLLMEFFIHLSREFTSDFLREFSIPSGKTSILLHDVLVYFNNFFADDITSKTLEERFSCNFDYLNRRFKQNTGKTIFYYLNELRIFQAKQLLQSGYYTLTEVAEHTGFHDVYYFSRVFKKYSGIAPSEFAKLDGS